MYLTTRQSLSSQLLLKEEKGISIIDFDTAKRKEINFFKGKYLGV